MAGTRITQLRPQHATGRRYGSFSRATVSVDGIIRLTAITGRQATLTAITGRQATLTAITGRQAGPASITGAN